MKYRYAVTKVNQLKVFSPKFKNPLQPKGKFATGRNNELIYLINEPSRWRRQFGLGKKIRFTGIWTLNKNYDLEFILDKAADQFDGGSLVLKAKIISTDRDTLVFEIKSYAKKRLSQIYLLKLSGCWQADEYNRITFSISNSNSKSLIFEGAWQINKNQQIIYKYERLDLKRNKKSIQTINFEGFWQIDSANRLKYILAHSPSSVFSFRVQLESPNLYPQDGVIKYRIGVGLSRQVAAGHKVISLYGAWRFNRKLGLNFEMEYAEGRSKSIEFGTEIYLSKKDTVVFSLNNSRNEPLGINVSFTHRFLKKVDAEAFLRLKNALGERSSSIEAGVRIPF